MDFDGLCQCVDICTVDRRIRQVTLRCFCLLHIVGLAAEDLNDVGCAVRLYREVSDGVLSGFRVFFGLVKGIDRACDREGIRVLAVFLHGRHLHQGYFARNRFLEALYGCCLISFDGHCLILCIQLESFGGTCLFDSVGTQAKGQGIGSPILFRGKCPDAFAGFVSHCINRTCKAVERACRFRVCGGFDKGHLAGFRLIRDIRPLGGSQTVSDFQLADSLVRLVTFRGLGLTDVVLFTCQDRQGI